MSEATIPSSTYRLQLNHDFPFPAAESIVGYLDELGVGAVYSSPFFQARADSTHGYDIADHGTINTSLGGREAFNSFTDQLKARDMLHVADFVPNHMGIGETSNAWWIDVLENGPSSTYAPYFDIDWDPLKDELANKVLLPILGDQYGRILERGELRLELESGAFFIKYWEHILPLNPRTYTLILEKAVEGISDEEAEKSEWIELRSIITACSYLPPRTETDPQRIAERAREKEVIKRRIEALAEESPAIRQSLEAAIGYFNGQVGFPRSFDALDELLDKQAYRLSFWRTAAEEINYRRFFDINDLAALRMEQADVFASAHELLFDLVAEGRVHGLRIDHPDGLYDPKGYFDRLQRDIGALPSIRSRSNGRNIWLIGEKILCHGERLPSDWRVHGTTGYDFMNQINRVLIDPAMERPFNDLYLRFIDGKRRFQDLVYEKKMLVLRLSLSNDVNVLGHMLNKLSERNRYYRDYTLNSLIAAVREVIACFPVYRTYLVPGQPVSMDSRRIIMSAVAQARRRNPALEGSVFEFVGDILQFQLPENVDEDAVQAHYDFVMRFQQISAPTMAKGVEDTAFYIYNRLAALNEVGGEPDEFGSTIEEFHETQKERQLAWPHAMTSLSTHDTKRSEDVRARLVALSEMPNEWRRAIKRWATLNERHRKDIEGDQAPSRNEEYLLYQTLVGTWPIDPMSAEEHQTYIERIQNYMQKALKEAKENTSWIQPNDAWDGAVSEFIAAILKRGSRNAFLRAFKTFSEEIAQLGAIYSLAQKTVQLTVPGVPDVYQGTEIWDFSLVDPDNRRTVDYASRKQMLKQFKKQGFGDFIETWQSGLPKLGIVQRLLHLRRHAHDLFSFGSYLPLQISGPHAHSVLAFGREYQDQRSITLVPRVAKKVGWPCLGEVWENTSLKLEGDWGNTSWQSAFDPAKEVEAAASIPVGELLDQLPVAVLHSKK